MLLAVVILSWMVVWMKSQGRSMRGRLEAEAHRAATMGAASLAALAFVAVGREGLETALFLFAAYGTSSASSTIIGGLLGLAVAAALGVALYRGSHRLNLRAFFTYTGLLLVFIAGGLLAHGIHEFQEAGLLPVLVEHLWDANSVLDEDSNLGGLLKGLFGYDGNPSLIEVVAYVGYLATTLTYFLRTPRAEPAGARVAGSGQAGSGALLLWLRPLSGTRQSQRLLPPTRRLIHRSRLQLPSLRCGGARRREMARRGREPEGDALPDRSEVRRVRHADQHTPGELRPSASARPLRSISACARSRQRAKRRDAAAPLSPVLPRAASLLFATGAPPRVRYAATVLWLRLSRAAHGRRMGGAAFTTRALLTVANTAGLPTLPTTDLEEALFARGFSNIAGIDEVGRGPLAGPVVAAAVILPRRLSAPWVQLVRDSKQLTPGQRAEAYIHLVAAARTYGLGACSPREIDRIGIASATRLAMARAVEMLDPQPDHLLIDALPLPALPVSQTPVIKGDSLSLSIAAASIIAKVTRDRLMSTIFEERFPGYGFATHKGYATPDHLDALHRIGPSSIHRRTFRPVCDILGHPRHTE